MPLNSIDDSSLRLRGGIFRADGSYVPESGLITNGKVIVGPGKEELPEPTRKLTGHSLYLGVSHYHYGHFLVETFSRLWGMKRDDFNAFDHILLLPLNCHVPDFAWDLFRALGLFERVRVIEKPVALETVTIPSPAIEYPKCVHRQLASIPRLFDGVLEVMPSDQPLFLSRTDLVPGHHRVLIGEERLEQALADQGVRIFHPQHHSVLEQAAVLRNHHTLIGFAGSALHTLLLSGGGHRVVAYSARNVPAVFPLLDKALCNQATYIRAARNSLRGLVNMSVGFSPEIIDPRPILLWLQRTGVIRRFDLGDYGTPEADALEVRRYNTALIMRRALEVSQRDGDATCHAEVMAFRKERKLDEDLIARACQSSELMRRFFMV